MLLVVARGLNESCITTCQAQEHALLRLIQQPQSHQQVSHIRDTGPRKEEKTATY